MDLLCGSDFSLSGGPLRLSDSSGPDLDKHSSVVLPPIAPIPVSERGGCTEGQVGSKSCPGKHDALGVPLSSFCLIIDSFQVCG